MATTTMINKLSDIREYDGDIESALVAQIPTYTPLSAKITACDTQSISSNNSHSICFGGYYFEDGSGTLPANATAPYYIVARGSTFIESQPVYTTFQVVGLESYVDIDPIMLECSTVTDIIAIPSTSTNFDSISNGYAIFGNAVYNYAAGGYGPSVPLTPNNSIAPFVACVKEGGNIQTMSSNKLGIVGSQTWLITDSGAASTIYPNSLNAAYYDVANDKIVAVGGAQGGQANKSSSGLWVEINDFTAFSIQPTPFSYGGATNPIWPASYRSIENISPSGENTIIMAGGTTSDSTGPTTGTAVLTLYTPNYQVAWGGGAARIAGLDNGQDNAGGFWAGPLGLSGDSLPTLIKSINRVTVDGEDIIFVGGTSGSSTNEFLYAISGVVIEDFTIKPLGQSTTVTFTEQKNISTFPPFTNLGYTTGSRTANFSVVGFADHKAKLLSGGYATIEQICPFAPIGAGGSNAGYIYSASRGMRISAGGIYQEIPSTSESYVLVGNVNSSSTKDVLYMINSAQGEKSISPKFATATLGTGNRAVAWFEYLMYDGIDSLVARKLHEMGVRVTIANVEWYKQDILKESLDVSSDFFTEWATEQQEQNKKRDRLAEMQGRPRPRKRQVRTEVFDDYADMEEKEAAVKNFPDYDPFKDGEPFKDDVEKQQEIQKTQKAVDDLQRIEDTIDEAANVQAEQREEDGAYDIGDNEGP